MSDIIGQGILRTVVDNSQMAPGIAQGVAALKKLEDQADTTGEKVDGAFEGLKEGIKEANKETVKLDATTKRFLAALEREGEQAGRTRSEFLELKAAKLGVTAEADRYISRIKAEEQAAEDLRRKTKEAADAVRGLRDAQNSTSRATNSNGMTERATNAALRNVPAQFTDIVVSLQGGQNPLTVLLQQGGQLKDMFNGAGNAAKALGGYILGIIGPTTILLGLAGAVGVAYYQGAQEIGQYNKALIMSGNYVGKTAEGLNSMAAGFRDVNITQGAAAEGLAAVAGTGKVAGAELEVVTQATINLSKVGGQDLKDALANFVALGEDPVKASAKLNESYNYLTVSVYEQIKALKENNREDEAAALAQRTFANAVNERALQVKESLGYIERAYRGVIDTAKQAWDAMMNVGRESTFAQKYTDQMDRVAALKKVMDDNKGTARGDRVTNQYIEQNNKLTEMMRQYNAENEKAAKAASDAKDVKNGITAVDSVSRLQQQAKGINSVTEELKKYHKQLDDIRLTNPNSELLSPANIKAGEDAIRKAHQGTKEKTKAFRDDEGTKYLQTLKEQGAALEAQTAQTEKLTASQKEMAKFEQLMVDLKTKGTLTADQKSLLANEEALRTQLKKNVATEDEIVAAKEVAKFKKEQAEAEKRAYDTFIARIKNNTLSASSRQEGRSEEYSRNLGAFGLGDNARQQIEAQRTIFKEYQSYQLELQKATPGSELGSDAYKSAVADIQSRLAEALAAHKQYYEDIKSLESDASIGQKQALANYMDSAANVAKSTANMWTSGMQQAEDALVTFVQTGKLSFKSLANSIIADLIRIQARQALSSFLSNLFGGFLGGGLQSAGLQSSGAVTSPTSSYGSVVGTALPPMSSGGFTGYGDKYDPAGIVHRGEVVFSQDDVARNGGVAAVEAMRKRGGRGFSSGGIVGGSGGGFAGGGDIIIQNNGAPLEVTGTKETPNANGGMDLTLIVRQLEGQMASNVQQGTGPMAKAIENRFGSKTAVR